MEAALHDLLVIGAGEKESIKNSQKGGSLRTQRTSGWPINLESFFIMGV
jgi:hypothetical protein